MNDKYISTWCWWLLTQVNLCACLNDEVIHPEGHSWIFPVMCYHSRWSKGKAVCTCTVCVSSEWNKNKHTHSLQSSETWKCLLTIPISARGFLLFSTGKVFNYSAENAEHYKVTCNVQSHVAMQLPWKIQNHQLYVPVYYTVTSVFQWTEWWKGNFFCQGCRVKGRRFLLQKTILDLHEWDSCNPRRLLLSMGRWHHQKQLQFPIPTL